MKSLGKPELSISSSGINSYENPGISFSSYGDYAARHFNIRTHVSPDKIQTSQQYLDTADIVVFMNKDVYEDALGLYSVNSAKCVVWDIKDVDEVIAARNGDLSDADVLNQIAVETYRIIRNKVSSLAYELTSVSWADIVDENNRTLGYRLPVSWASDRGLFRRGCHAIITTVDRKFLIEKRSKTIVFFPGRLDIGVGGGVDDGESPEHAVMREIEEETGIKINKEWLRLIDTRKWNTYHPSYKKYSRFFIYTYHVKIPVQVKHLERQAAEVAAIRLVGRRKIQTLLQAGRLVNFGRLRPGTAYYKEVVDLALKEL